MAKPIPRLAANALPLVRELDAHIREQHMIASDIAERAGMGRGTIRNWRAGGVEPRLQNFVSALHVLGLDLRIVRKENP